MFDFPLRWLRSYLIQFLGSFVKPECFEDLSASLWAGTLVLNNALLQESALDSLGLPLRLRSGRIGRLEVIIPWTSLYTSSIVIRIDNLELHADAEYDFAQEIARALQSRTAAIAEMKKKASDAAKQTIDPVESEKPSDPGMVDRLRTALLDNLQVQVNGARVWVHDAVTCPESPFRYGFTMDTLTYRVSRHLHLRCRARVRHCNRNR